MGICNLTKKLVNNFKDCYSSDFNFNDFNNLTFDTSEFKHLIKKACLFNVTSQS